MNKKTAAIATAPALLLAGVLTMGGQPATGPVTPADVVQADGSAVLPAPEHVDPNLLNPLRTAPEYVFAVTPSELLNLDASGSNYGTWTQMDALTDLYTLSELVRLRQAVEQLTASVEAQSK